ncbi:MAG TPA: 2-dehydropantoate 2-reductase [Steroidobacteraceae bacterium]|nr:2-dehydropantoate 2-reductase [Steroidobacteraceae bacterium]
MKICVVGAGAIGGFLGTRLALDPGNAVAALARGTTLVSLRDHGWRLRQDGALLQAPVANASDDSDDLGRQDLVILAVKAQALPALAPSLAPLLAADTMVMPAMNGVPWWFGAGVAALGTRPLESVDPGGGIAAAIPLKTVVGCVVHASVTSTEPGVTTHRMGRGLIVGEPSGGESARVARLGELLSRAGFEVTRSPRIRYDIWYKLWGNMTMNPVSALTGATTDRLLDDELVRSFCAAAMQEAAAVGARIGCDVRESAEDRQAVARELGVFKTSMLQDVEAGRTIELDALVGAVREIGQRVGVPTPMIDALFGLTRLFGQVRGLYPMHRPR